MLSNHIYLSLSREHVNKTSLFMKYMLHSNIIKINCSRCLLMIPYPERSMGTVVHCLFSVTVTITIWIIVGIVIADKRRVTEKRGFSVLCIHSTGVSSY